MTVLNPAQQRSLLGAYPKLRFAWPVNVGEAYIGNDAESLTYSIVGEGGQVCVEFLHAGHGGQHRWGV